MKKILMLSVFCGIFMLAGGASFASPTYGYGMQPLTYSAGSSLQKCILAACPDNDLAVGENQEYIRSHPGSDQCYSCDSDNGAFNNGQECGYGRIIGQRDVHDNEIIHLFQCVDITGAWDEWRSYNPTVVCNNSPLKQAATENGRTRYLLAGSKTTHTETAGDNDITLAGNDACVYYACNEGYIPNTAKTDCIVDNRQNVCETSGGVWSNNTCSCDAGKNLKLKADRTACECINNDYEFKSATQGCVETKEFKERKKKEEDDNRRKQQEQQNQQKAKRCRDSGGEWKGSLCKCDNAKNLREDGGVCVCLDDNYKRNGNKCDLTDEATARRECEAASGTGAYWETGQCKCDNPRNIYRGKKCVLNPAIENCEKVVGAVWDMIEKECRCKDDDKVLNDAGTACVESDDARAKREKLEAEAEVSAIQKRITSAADVLDSIRSGFKVSVWKDEKGNFNTSRLVSDSVAGVVLGTAGGLITSNIVKKNQIEDGFEDIQCTVGGQVISNWGDEFRVGIQ